MDTGKLIKELRIKKGMTQEVLAEKTEISSRTIQRIENGEVDPRAYTLQMIARALEVDFTLFVTDKTGEMHQVHKVNKNNWLGLIHLSGLIPIIFPTVLIWSLKKEEIKEITEHYRVAINFQLIMLGITLGCLWVLWQTNRLEPLFGVLLMNGLFAIVNTLKVMSGEPYLKTPFIKSSEKK